MSSTHENDLPTRTRGGRRVTEIRLEVVSAGRIGTNIVRHVRMPDPPCKPLTVPELIDFLKSLSPLVARAMKLLKGSERGGLSNRFQTAQHERIQLLVITDDEVIGRVNGAQQVFCPKDTQITHGVFVPGSTQRRR